MTQRTTLSRHDYNKPFAVHIKGRFTVSTLTLHFANNETFNTFVHFNNIDTDACTHVRN